MTTGGPPHRQGPPHRGFVATDADGTQYKVEEWMCCDVCGSVLERLGGETWLHPTWMRAAGEDHEPVPVPRTEVGAVNEVCDFCFAPNPRWELPTKNFPMPRMSMRPIDMSTSGWACCDVCAKLIDKGLWSGLVNHSIAMHRERQGEMLPEQEDYIRRLYRLVRRNAVGPVQLNEPHIDKEYGQGTGEEADVVVSGTVRWSGDGSSRAGAPPVPGGDRALRQR